MAMDPAKRKRALRALRQHAATRCKNDLYEFFKLAWRQIEPGTPLKESPHLRPFAAFIQKHVEQTLAGEVPDKDLIIVNVPPGSSKSSLISIVLPVWMWIHRPSTRIISASHDQKLATKHAVKSRRLLQSEWLKSLYPEMPAFRGDQNLKMSYENVAGGERQAVGITGGITGNHCHVFIYDDIIDPRQSESEAGRESAIKFWDQVAPSRILEGGLRILVMQRLHEKDPTGHALAKDFARVKEGERSRVAHLCLPAELSKRVKPARMRYLYDENGLLDPIRLPRERLKKFLQDLGSYAFAGQYGQSPAPPEGGVIKRKSWKPCDLIDLPRDTVFDLYVDGAYTDVESNDPTGILLVGYSRSNPGEIYIRYAQSRWLELPECVDWISQIIDDYGLDRFSRIWVEPKASGLSLIPTLRKRLRETGRAYLKVLQIKGDIVKFGKDARIYTTQPAAEAGDIWYVRGPYMESVIEQHAKYPKADHDEYVDLVGYAVHKNGQRRGSLNSAN